MVNKTAITKQPFRTVICDCGVNIGLPAFGVNDRRWCDECAALLPDRADQEPATMPGHTTKEQAKRSNKRANTKSNPKGKRTRTPRRRAT